VPHNILRDGGVLESGKFSVNFFENKNYSSDAFKNKCFTAKTDNGKMIIRPTYVLLEHFLRNKIPAI